MSQEPVNPEPENKQKQSSLPGVIMKITGCGCAWYLLVPAMFLLGIPLAFYNSWNETRIIKKHPERYLNMARSLISQQEGTTVPVWLTRDDIPPLAKELDAQHLFVSDLELYEDGTGLFEGKYAVQMKTSGGFIYRGYWFVPDLTEAELTIMEKKIPRGVKSDGKWERIHPQIFKYGFSY